jgi:hypothetical protein
VKNIEVKLVAYADDITIITNSEKDLTKVIDIFNYFQKLSGLGISTEKSEVLCCGYWKKNPPLLPFKSVNSIKITGITFSTNPEETANLNYSSLAHKIIHKINKLKGQGLSLLGRVQVIKSLIYSLLQFPAAIIQPTKNAIKLISRYVYDFLWKGVDQLERNRCAQNVQDAGLDLEKPETRCKATFISTLLNLENRSHPWIKILKNSFLPFGGIEILNRSLNVNEIKTFIPSHVLNLVKVWQDILGVNVKVNTVHSLPLHGQLWTTDKGNKVKTKIYKNLLRKNITQIGQLVDVNQKPWSLEVLKKSNFSPLDILEYNAAMQATQEIRKEWTQKDNRIFSKRKSEYPDDIPAPDEKWVISVEKEKIRSQKQIVNIIKKLNRGSLPAQINKLLAKNIINILPNYNLPRETTISTRDRSFFLNMQLGLINGNYVLKLKGKVPDEHCQLCEEKPIQRNEHLFLQCEKTNALWNEVNCLLHNINEPPLTPDEILGGCNRNKTLRRIAMNKVILACWKAITNANRNNTIPKLKNVVNELKLTRTIESQSVQEVSRRRLRRHKGIWNIITVIFPNLDSI